VIARLVAIPEAALHKFCPDAPSSRHNIVATASGPYLDPATAGC